MKKALLFAIAVVSLTLANILAGYRFMIGPVAVTMGVFLIPILLIIGDTIHEVYGFKASRMVTHIAIGGCVVIYAILHVTGIQPTGLFVAVRIIAGSMIAAELGDLTNDLVFRHLQRTRPANMKLRHLGSSAPALLVDALVFQIIRNGPLPMWLPFAHELNRFSFNWVGVVASFVATGTLRILVEHLLWPVTNKVIDVYINKQTTD
jgi:uncharacterized PurR-regulated membrane protein YhhQ (DUF165 family)